MLDHTSIESFSAWSAPLTASSGPVAGPVLGNLPGNDLGTLLPTEQPGEVHNLHPLANLSLPLEPHGSHALGVSQTAAAMPLWATYAATTLAGGGESAWSPVSAWESWESGAHHSRGESNASGDVVAKFAPKRCTVRFTSKDVSRNVMGDRKCNCARRPRPRKPLPSRPRPPTRPALRRLLPPRLLQWPAPAANSRLWLGTRRRNGPGRRSLRLAPQRRSGAGNGRRPRRVGRRRFCFRQPEAHRPDSGRHRPAGPRHRLPPPQAPCRRLASRTPGASFSHVLSRVDREAKSLGLELHLVPGEHFAA